jgi:YD repeat-containing protein
VLPDGREVAFAYDSAGNLTGVTPPGKLNRPGIAGDSIR